MLTGVRILPAAAHCREQGHHRRRGIAADTVITGVDPRGEQDRHRREIIAVGRVISGGESFEQDPHRRRIIIAASVTWWRISPADFRPMIARSPRLITRRWNITWSWIFSGGEYRAAMDQRQRRIITRWWISPVDPGHPSPRIITAGQRHPVVDIAGGSWSPIDRDHHIAADHHPAASVTRSPRIITAGQDHH